MKQLIITFLFFTVSISPGFAQENAFDIVDIHTVQENIIIVSCRDNIGRTIQFQAGTPLTGNPRLDEMTKKKINALTLGLKVIADFTSETVSPVNDNSNKYNMVQPSFSNQCGSIDRIEYHSGFDFVVVKPDPATGSNYFLISSSVTPNLHLQTGQPIYEKYYNKMRYAILKPGSLKINKNISYSYPFNVNTPNNYNNPNPPTPEVVHYVVESNAAWEITGPTSYPQQGPDKGSIIASFSDQKAEFTFKIYSDTTLLFSGSGSRVMTLPPQKYNMEISGMSLKNVPVIMGDDTRIKVGALYITSTSFWTLYDENKTKTIYSSSLPKNVVFPCGIYQLEINGLVHQIEIKDGETLEYSDTSSQTAQTQKLNTGTQPMWDIQTDSSLSGATGQIILQMPKNIKFMSHLQVFKHGDSQVAISWFGNNKSQIMPGLYDVVVEKYRIANVPIEKGKTTRLKMGFLIYSPRGPVRIVDAYKQEFPMAGPFEIALPPGTYYVDGKKDQAFVIKDGELTKY